MGAPCTHARSPAKRAASNHGALSPRLRAPSQTPPRREMIRPMPHLSSLRFLAMVIALGASGCVEAATYEKATSEIAELRRASQLKDEQLRALQWQVAVVAQQLRETVA